MTNLAEAFHAKQPGAPHQSPVVNGLLEDWQSACPIRRNDRRLTLGRDEGVAGQHVKLCRAISGRIGVSIVGNRELQWDDDCTTCRGTCHFVLLRREVVKVFDFVS